MTVIQDLSGWGGWQPGSDGRVLRAGHICRFLEASDAKPLCFGHSDAAQGEPSYVLFQHSLHRGPHAETVGAECGHQGTHPVAMLRAPTCPHRWY